MKSMQPVYSIENIGCKVNVPGCVNAQSVVINAVEGIYETLVIKQCNEIYDDVRHAEEASRGKPAKQSATGELWSNGEAESLPEISIVVK